MRTAAGFPTEREPRQIAASSSCRYHQKFIYEHHEERREGRTKFVHGSNKGGKSDVFGRKLYFVRLAKPEMRCECTFQCRYPEIVYEYTTNSIVWSNGNTVFITVHNDE